MGLEHLIVDNGSELAPLLVTADRDNKVRIACPKCGHIRIVDAVKFPDDRKLLRVKCVCGATFPCRMTRKDGKDADADLFSSLPGPHAPGMLQVACPSTGEGPIRVECPYCESTRYVARERFQVGNRSLVIQCGCENSFVLRMVDPEEARAAEAVKNENPADTVKELPEPPAVQEAAAEETAILAETPKPGRPAPRRKGKKTKPMPDIELPEVVADVVKSAAKAAPKPGRPDRELRSDSGQWAIGNAEPGAADGDDLRRFYADKQGDLHIACPVCEYVKSVPVAGLSKIVQPARVHCVCGNVFHCYLEFRRTYRKEVSLPGDYICLRDKDEGKMIVQDLSLEGIGFRTLGPHTMQVDDIVEVRFELDDRSRSKIRRQVRVRSVRGRFIVGAMFANLHFRDKALGFYLMP